MLRNKKGFTLIEMLVVIAIIAVLVSVIIPVVSRSTTKAAAVTDAANLRSVLGVLNSELGMGNEIEPEVVELDPPESKLNPGAKLYVLYTNPGFIDVYYVKNGAYYGLDYLADVGENGETEISTSKPTTSGTWYIAGEGKLSSGT